MKQFHESFDLSTNGQVLTFNIIGTLRALGLDGIESEGELSAEVLDVLRIGLVSPNVSGEVLLTDEERKDCHYIVADNVLRVFLTRLCAGVHTLSVSLKYGTNDCVQYIADLRVAQNLYYLNTGDGSEQSLIPLRRDEDKDEDGKQAYVYDITDAVVWVDELSFTEPFTAWLAVGAGVTLENATEVPNCTAVINADMRAYDPEIIRDLQAVVNLGSEGGGGGGGGIPDAPKDGEQYARKNGRWAIVDAYQLPAGGIPKSTLSAPVQTSLGKADTALQSSALAGYETSQHASETYQPKGEYATKAELEEVRLFKFPNATIFGSPVINNGQVSGFSANDYLRFPFLVDFAGRAFMIEFEVTTGQVASQENILDSDFGLAFAVRDARFILAVGTSGTSWAYEWTGTHPVQAHSTYLVRIVWTGGEVQVLTSTDGGTEWLTDINEELTEQPYPKQMYIGVGQSGGAVLNSFSGIINMNKAQLIIANKLVWQGMDDAGLATRLATDLGNIDAAGEERVRDIVGGGRWAVVEDERQDPVFAITSANYTENTLIHCGVVSSFTLSEVEQLSVEVSVQFRTGASVTGMPAIPEGTKYIGDLTVEADKEYILTVLDGVVVIGEVKA